MVVPLLGFILISKASAVNLFADRLAQLEGKGFTIRTARTVLLESFEAAWSHSTYWAVLVGGFTAAILSLILARIITRPLTQIEQTIHQIAAGDLQERVPSNAIPELNRLSRSFNRMAIQLDDVEQRRRELITDLTHELRTPLTILQGYLETWATGKLTPNAKAYQLLIQETKRLERLTNDVQELSVAEAGHLTLDLQPLALRPLIEELIQTLSHQLTEDGPCLRLDCPSESPQVLADPARTKQILVNLLGNALRHTKSGTVTIQVQAEERDVWIAVQDTGSGIAADDLPHVFERFWRSEEMRSQATRGTGIGLAITRRLVELQSGQITAESQLGIGSTFRFSLPKVN
ncbi:sensor histidine kinase [Acaryochloris thomasi]|nr:HAMP domain-containing sensor histidine kinase [Acaryochloris thomasi]